MTMPEIINLQRKVKLDLEKVRRFAEELMPVADELTGRHFSVAFVNDVRMRQLNQVFRGKDQTTDVLSFPHKRDDFDPDKGNLGDIVISAEQAQRQAGENGLSMETELQQLILHGVLHLCGYDHETDKGQMDDRELELRRVLEIG
jgi:probable rRNA maturation factor